MMERFRIVLKTFTIFKNEGILELQWKSPGRLPSQEQVTPIKHVEPVNELPEEELKLREKQKLLSTFEAEEMSNQSHTPSSLSKTLAKTPKSTVKTARASFDKIFSKVSLQSSAGVDNDSKTDDKNQQTS